MSATKSVTYRNRFFWAYDIVLGVFLKYLIDVVEEADAPFLAESVASWRIAAIYDFGCSFEESWTPEQTQMVIRFAEEACARLATMESISTEEIGSWTFTGTEPVFHRGLKEVRTSSVIELGRAIIDLLRGELAEPPDGETWFFTDTGRETIKKRSSPGTWTILR